MTISKFMLSERRRRTIAVVVAILVVGVGSLLVVRVNTQKEAADPVDMYRNSLNSDVMKMYRAVYDENYEEASRFRSYRCVEKLPSDQYAASLRQVLKSENNHGKDVKFTVRFEGEDRAYVNIISPSPSSSIGGERRWTQVARGVWRFDNC